MHRSRSAANAGLLFVEVQGTCESGGEFIIEFVSCLCGDSGGNSGDLKSEGCSDFNPLSDWLFCEAHTAFERVERGHIALQ